MKRFLVFLLVFVCCLPFVYGTQRLVGANWDVPFTEPYPATANDFHVNIDLKSANNVAPDMDSSWAFDHVGPNQGGTSWYMNGMSLQQDQTDPQMWHVFMDFKTTGGAVFNGATVHFGAEFNVEDFNYFRVRMAYWTKDGEYLCPAQVLGFHVWESLPGIVDVELYNDSAEIMVIEQLEFAVTPFRVPLQDMFYTGLGAPGEQGKYPQIKWMPVNNPIKIDPGKSIKINLNSIGVIIQKDEYLQFRANVNTVPQWWQHQH